jgi:hypothetical protein
VRVPPAGSGCLCFLGIGLLLSLDAESFAFHASMPPQSIAQLEKLR